MAVGGGVGRWLCGVWWLLEARWCEQRQHPKQHTKQTIKTNQQPHPNQQSNSKTKPNQTKQEYTSYHFEVDPRALPGALERFAQFFVAPLCKRGAMAREVQAVDSEFAGVLQDDHCRLCQLMCHTSREGHVFNKFSWGNKRSLWDGPEAAGVDVRARLLEYYCREYGAERMCLAVLGGEPLDELEALVRRLFEAVPGGRVGPARTFASEGPPFEGRTLYVAPAVRQAHEVTVTFPLPPLRSEYATKPEHYISHLVGHEGAGSLLSALKVCFCRVCVCVCWNEGMAYL
jgi:nardilysin